MYKTSVQKTELKELLSFPGNPQEVPSDKMALIIKDMKKRGFYGEYPLIAILDDIKYIVSGNHRVQCAIEAGIEKANCIIIDDPEYGWEQAKKDCLKFNSLKGELNKDKMKDFINEMDSFNFGDIGLDKFDFAFEDDEDILHDEIKTYRKIHFLISVDIDKYDMIRNCIENMEEIEEVEIEQGQN